MNGIKEGKVKIGRNDPCPCGSGKKYKKCCLSDDRTILNLDTFLNDLKDDFAEYDMEELLKTISGLQLYPKNHSQLIRLEVASRIACSNISSGNKKINGKELNKLLKKYLPAEGPIGILEDPIEGLFTDNIIFGNNYIVYPGLTRLEPFIVRNFLETLFLWNNDDFPKDFLDTILIVSQAMLTLSNEIAKRMKHVRYMSSPDRWRKEIEMPKFEEIKRLQDAVTFTKEELNTLLKPYNMDYRSYGPFIISPGHESFNVEQIDKNPLLTTPLVFLNNKIIVVAPGSLIGALRHFILLISKKFGVTKKFVNKLRGAMWTKIRMQLNKMDFDELDLKLPNWKKELLYNEGVFRIDTNKLAYVMVITDNLEGYKTDEPYSTWNAMSYIDSITKRCELISQYLINKEKCENVLIIIIMNEMGRYSAIGTKNLPENTCILLMTTEELDIVEKTRKCDNLTLWKFAKALENIKFPTAPSFLDTYALYLKNRHSFYLSDDVKPDAIFIGPDTLFELGKKMRIEVTNRWDSHAARHNNSYGEVFKIENSVPIYFLNNCHFAEHLIEGYSQPLWVECAKKLTNSESMRSLCFEMAGTLSYWLWQFTPDLKKHLKVLGKTPIRIKFDLKNCKKWLVNDNIEDMSEKTNYQFLNEIDTESRTINFEIPDDIIKSLKRDDNKAEIIIMDELMSVLGLFLSKNGFDNTLTKIERRKILEKYAPLGIKKRILIFQDERPDLNPYNLPKLRKLQEHDTEEQLIDLAYKLEPKQKVGEVLTKKRKVELCNKIVDHCYEELKSNIKKFDWRPLLESLISDYEVLLFNRAMNHIFTGPSIACYDISSKLEAEIKDVSERDNTALSLRTLIEILAAEQENGNKKLSTDDFDKLLASAYNLIYWSMISEQIHCDILDIKMSILASGRIGVDGMESLFDPFRRSKTLENVEVAMKNFSSDYKIRKPNDSECPDEKLDQIFESEFGLTLTDLANFCGTLTSLGFKETTKVPHMHLSKLKKSLKEELEWSDEKIEKVITNFSLSKRIKWEKPPKGFDSNDIWPWRYNRRLSYIKRPLIISSEPKEDPLVFWGPRNAYLMGINLLDNVMGGDYKIHKNSSEAMKSYKAKVLDIRGKLFTKNVETWFKQNTNLKVFAEVNIGPGEILNSDEDLGDIDILVIDEKNGIIYSVECKDMHYGRNPRQVSQEMRRLIGDEKNEKSWMNKHIKRDKWLKNNIELLKSNYDLNSNSFKMVSIFLISQEILTRYIKKMPLKTITFPQLKRKGESILLEIFNQ